MGTYQLVIIYSFYSTYTLNVL